MNRKLLTLNLVASTCCACLLMAYQVPAAMNNLVPGFIADLVSTNSQSNLPPNITQSKRWDLLQIQAPEAWPLVSDEQNVVVAVLDTGIDDTDKSLKGKVIARTNFTDDTSPDTKLGHGTFVAGIIASRADNSNIVGVAYNSLLMDVKVANNDGTTDAQKVAQGIIWAADHGANVINISIVINQPYPLLEYAVNYAWKKGCLIVAAAGNNASSEAVYPASYPNVISVAATDKADCLARWSNRGDWVSVAAPGVDIFSTLPNEESGFKSGTSFSAALVSGEAALLFPNAIDTNGDGQINDEVRNTILNDSDNLQSMDTQTRRINVYDAAQAEDNIRGMLVN